MLANDIERLFGHRQRQQVRDIDAIDDAPGQMLGDEPGLESLDDFANPPQMIAIERLCAAKRKSDAVQRDRIIAPDRFQIRGSGAAAHVVLGMNLEPSNVGMRVDDGLMVLKAQPYPR